MAARTPSTHPIYYIGADEVEAYVVYLRDERGMADSSRKNHLAVLRSFFQTLSRRLELPDPTRTLDEVRFHSGAPKRSYLTRREAEILLSSMDKQVTDVSSASEEDLGVHEARRRALAVALAARDHAAFSAMIYAGLRIEETTALTLEDLSFARGEEEVRVARGKGNKERVVPMSPKLKRSLRRYLKVRNDIVPAGKTPPPHLFLNEKGERVTENTLRRHLYGWVRKSGLKKAAIKPHDLRRTFGTWFLQANPGHVRELAELMGHSDLSQVMKYALADEVRARAGVAKL
jgi:integrase/recombinase XerD